MHYHVYADFGISKNFYGHRKFVLEGTGQGNSISGAICRDISYLIFKYLEDQQLGAKIIIKKSNKNIQRVAIAFINDIDFYANGDNFE